MNCLSLVHPSIHVVAATLPFLILLLLKEFFSVHDLHLLCLQSLPHRKGESQ